MRRHFGALQGLAMLLVVFVHSIQMGLDATTRFGYPPIAGWSYYFLITINNLGMFAVPTFLFISGCFFAYAARNSDPPRISWKMVWTSLKHLWWPYLFWSIAFYAVLYFTRRQTFIPPVDAGWQGQPSLTQAAGQLQTYPLFQYLKNLITGFPFNFIPLLAFYYLLSPLIVSLAKRFGLILIIVIMLYQLFLLNFRFPGILGFTWPNWLRYFIPKILGESLSFWAIYFPLGLIYSINANRVLPWLQKFKWTSLAVTMLFFMISLLNLFSVWSFPLAGFIAPLTFVLFAPTIERNSVPRVRELESIGKRAYGLYLTNLITLELSLLAIHIFIGRLFGFPLLLILVSFVLTLGLPLWVMNGLIRLPTRAVYRYVFG